MKEKEQDIDEDKPKMEDLRLPGDVLCALLSIPSLLLHVHKRMCCKYLRFDCSYTLYCLFSLSLLRYFFIFNLFIGTFLIIELFLES